MNTQLSSMAMLASLHISTYTARKYDKKASQEVADWHQTDEKAGRYNKNLLPADAASYKAIGAEAGAGRLEFYKQTLPWLDDGARILTAANFIPCTQIMQKRESAFKNAIPPFIAEFPLLKARAKASLNGLYREEDYPSVDKLKARFAFDLKFYPMPDARDFRAELRQEDVDAIKKQIDQDAKASVAKAMEEPYKRLFDGVAHMASRLNGKSTCPCRSCKGKKFTTDTFSDSLVDNLIDLCEVLPRLNLTGDQDLVALIDEVKTGLTPFKADLLRDKGALRQTLADRAAALQAEVGAYFQAA